MTATKQVICINWGTKYGPAYINRLYGMVARNITPPFTFTCFTDTPDGIRPEVLCEDLPPIAVEMPTGTLGIWPKSRLWGPKLGALTGPVLFMDLDLVITGSLDAFFDYGAPEDVILSPNPSNPLEKLGQTSVFRFSVGSLLPLQQQFEADPQGVADEYRFEQRFVTRNAPGGVKLFPTPWVRHFRRHCRRPFPLNYVLPPRLPADARIVIFPGSLEPYHAIEGRYDEASPQETPLGHIRRTFGKTRTESVWAHLRHYILPTGWVADYWRE